MSSTCINCRFWQLISDSDQAGYCRRHAPVPTHDRFGSAQARLWPITTRTDWCGEYEEGRG